MIDGIDLAERAFLPDWLIRLGMKRLLAARLREQLRREHDQPGETFRQFMAESRRSAVAVATDSANEQHYEVPSEFFQTVLGPRLKYSCCFWPEANTTLARAEDEMLALFCRRAGIEDGMNILELGCGWGSLCLWIAEHYPGCRIQAVSNSRTQRDFIEQRRRDRGLAGIEVVTANVADFDTERRFDRVVSVEMFEHVRNHEELLRRIATWLNPDGMLMVHIFCHARFAYPFETEGRANWMGRHFFTGGVMPSDDLLPHLQRDLVLKDHWRVSGMHYSHTLDEWLANCDRNLSDLLELFARHSSPECAKRLIQRWRMFFMACSELFSYRGGTEWFVSHYLFSKRCSEGHVNHGKPSTQA